MISSYILVPDSNFYKIFEVYNKLESFPKNSVVLPGNIEPIITHQGINLVWVMKWGLIPFWAKERGVGDHMYNLKADSVVNKPAFKKAFSSQRCLIPANGFYIDNKYLIKSEDRDIFSFAGIYDIWQEPVSGHEVYTYSIITVDSNLKFKKITDQMPVIFTKESEKTWLDSRTNIQKLNSLLKITTENLTIVPPIIQH